MNRSERSAWTAFHTTDLDEAHAFLSASYMEIRVSRSVPRPAFSLGTLFAYLGDTAVSRARYRARTRLSTPPFEDPCFVHLTGGGYRVTGCGDDHAAATGEAFVLPPHARLDVSVDDFRLTTVTLPSRLVNDVARTLTDVPAGAAVRFESVRPVSKPLERQWISTVAHVQHAILSHPDLAGNALIAGQARRLLAASALTAFPNSTMRLDADPPGTAGRAAVRRAVDYIDANRGRDVSPTEIADAARVAVPALMQAFRTHLGTTPMAYLRRSRLELAHRDLDEADVEQVSVTEVARRWGFLDARRFATEYRRAYGRAPSETLRS